MIEPPTEAPEPSTHATDLEAINLEARVPGDLARQRFDQVAALLFPDYSRARLQEWIRGGQLTLNGNRLRPGERVMGGEHLVLRARLEHRDDWQPEAMALPLVYEDKSLLVIDKPAGLVVHPAAGNYSGTLLNALLHHCPDLAGLPRAGIVHRLDKDTTGLMVVAKTLQAHTSLVAQLQQRSVSREYEAVVQGVMTGGGTVDAAIGRHPKARQRMAVLDRGGKDAVSHYQVLERFAAHTHVRVRLETGRTHQIRVHMAHIRYPLVGDAVYAGRFKAPRGATTALLDTLRAFPRQALHAAQLGLIHPATGELCRWTAPLPDDMQTLLTALRQDRQETAGQ